MFFTLKKTAISPGGNYLHNYHHKRNVILLTLKGYEILMVLHSIALERQKTRWCLFAGRVTDN